MHYSYDTDKYPVNNIMNRQAYFDRINYHGSTDLTYETLCALYQAHMSAIPFENLNIHIPKPIILSENALFQKIVYEKRGGFCFEQNGFFALVLRQLGFDVTLLEGNVHNSETDSYGIRFNHLTLLVTLDEMRYLVDVGFGGAAYGQPLELGNPDVQERPNGRFKIVLEEETGYYYEHFNGNDAMKIGYRFFMTPRVWADFEDACVYMQTESQHFTQRRVCSQLRDELRITLSDNKFIQTTLSGDRTETPVTDEAQFHEILQREFAIGIKTVPPDGIRES